MDIIFMDENRTELGILQHCILDYDVAKDKDFELKTLDDEGLLKAGWWWYIPNTEYGGRIDKISHDTKSKVVTYYGRNWRGIMASKIIAPASYTSKIYAEGSVVDSLNALVERCGLDDLILVTDEDTEIYTEQFLYKNYVTMYDGMISLLDSVNSKMRLNYDGDAQMLIMTVGLKADFTDYITYISDNSLNYVVSQRRGGINHLVCLGKEDEDTGYRAVIHLFTDENYNIQPYRRTENPLRNRDYYLDTSKQIIEGIDERTAVFENNGGITYHYVLLTGEPQKWATECTQYYQIDENQSGEDLSTARYKSVDWEIDDVYTLTASEPSDWSYNYSNYYYISGIDEDGKFKYSKAGMVDDADVYTTVPSPPSDWNYNFSAYYMKKWDGTKYIYEAIRSDTSYTWEKQTKKPTDWATNYHSYYSLEIINPQEEPKYTYKKLSTIYTSMPTFKKNQFYKKVTSTKYEVLTSYDSAKWKTDWKNFYVREAGMVTVVANWKPVYDYVPVKATASGKAPTWASGKYYTRYGTAIAPSWADVKAQCVAICSKTVPRVRPEWEEDTYYSYQERKVAPSWLYGKYYERTEDWFKELVEAGIEKLADLNKSESQTVTLADIEAEIGDTVSGYDTVTGVEVREAVTNIIVRIKNGVIALDYEIGGRA